MTDAEVTVWSAAPGLLSEGPRWHGERQELLWVDILGRQLHRARVGADGAMEPVRTITVDRHVGAAAPAVGGYVLAAGQGFLFLDEPSILLGGSRLEGGERLRDCRAP